MNSGLPAVRTRCLAAMLALGLTVLGTPICATAAGNVVVKQIGGALRIRGDAAANKISLENDGGDIGVGSFDGIGTINGGSAPFIAHGVRAVTIDLGAGDDWITLEDFHANFGDVPWDLRINTGSGNDTIDASDSGAASLQIATGPGDDVILWDGGGCTSLTIHTGTGADQIWMSSFEVTGKTLIDTGAGPDLVWSFVEQFGGDVTVETGAGDDTVSLASSRFDGAARFEGGAGTDAFQDDQSTFNGGVAVKHFEH
jgi:hypothetical protein